MLEIKTRGEYDEIISDLKKCVESYKKTYKEDNIYTLFLANGKRIQFSINENNLPHLLGVKTDNLISKSMLRRDKTYKTLLNFIENSYSIYINITKGVLNYSDVFSPYIKNKLDVFNDQLKTPYPKEIYFVCEYDKTKNYTKKDIDEFTADYYVARKRENCGDIILLGLKKRENNIYAVQTSRVIKNDEKYLENLNNLLDGQVVTYVNTLRVENYQTGYRKETHLGIEEKKEVINNLINISNKTNSITNTIQNHLFDIISVSKCKNELFSTKILLSQLISAMKNNEIFDISGVDSEITKIIDEEMQDVINGYNNYICSGSLNNDCTNQKYSDVVNERDNLSKEKEELNEKLKKLEEEKNKLLEEKENLEKYKDSYETFTSKIFSLTDEEKAKKEGLIF